MGWESGNGGGESPEVGRVLRSAVSPGNVDHRKCEGCYEDPLYEGDPGDYSFEEFEACIALRLRLTRNGHLVPDGGKGFYDGYDYDSGEAVETGFAS